ncbi:hypothetical protein HDU76_000214 [Blyttiomyces sp. JEL0837]|nr:hypothetical protein HDU76_000214 [Blyttiomyces sp. JEL0837]
MNPTIMRLSMIMLTIMSAMTSTAQAKPGLPWAKTTTTKTTTTPVPTNKAPTKSFTLNIAYSTQAPDGYSQRMMLANGQIDYPIEVTKGDNVAITVNNGLDVPTSLHWHGLFQKATPWYDGAANVTQCPIQPNSSLTYTFSTDGQVGTYWWHAHLMGQYVDGLRGPFIIKDPQGPYNTLYDEDLTMTLTDFHHNSSASLLTYYTAPNQGNFEPVPESGLINGKGRYNCTFAPRTSKCVDNAPLEVVNVVPGKRYRIRLINTSAMSSFTFSIDNHNFTVIESDGVDTVAVNATQLKIMTSQRYSIIVNADQLVDNYWIRADLDTGAPSIDPTTTTQETPETLNPYTLYELVNTYPQDLADWDQSFQFLFTIQPAGAMNVTTSTVTMRNTTGGDTVDLFTDNQYRLPQTPTLFDGINGKTSFPNASNVVHVKNNTYVWMQIVNDDSVEHTFHLHGHTFWVLFNGHLLHAPMTGALLTYPPCTGGTGAGGESGCLKGLLNILVHFDHPGAWLFHCHVSWHMDTGLQSVFANLDGLPTLGKQMPTNLKNMCGAQKSIWPF